MLSPLMIVSLDQGKLYGSKPTIDEVHAGMVADLGLAPDEAKVSIAAEARSGDDLGWPSRLREWMTAMARRQQPTY